MRLMADTLPVLVRLPALFERLFPEAPRLLELEATSVAALLASLDARWPGMRDRIADTSPAIRRHVNIFVNGTKVTLDAPLPPGADVFILTAISGG